MSKCSTFWVKYITMECQISFNIFFKGNNAHAIIYE